MPDVREKLVELQSIITCPNAICNFCEHFKNKSACEKRKKEVIADNMIANGVTIQRWIPVEERLPEMGQEVICFSGGVLKPGVYCYLFWSKDYDNWARVTHWMPLPPPPKEE